MSETDESKLQVPSFDPLTSDPGQTKLGPKPSVANGRGANADNKREMQVLIEYEPAELDELEKSRVGSLRKAIDQHYEAIPKKLRDLPEAQRNCLEFLSKAEQLLTPPISRKDVIDAKLALARLEIEMGRSQTAMTSFLIVVLIMYFFGALVAAAIYTDRISVDVPASILNSQLIMGIPFPIWLWAAIGSLTSMLLRAGQSPFPSRTEALRWLMFRPIVGVVMGVLTYLMVTAGLIVFAGSSKAQTPELLWIIAFVGSFSDSLSINLLDKLLGRFQVSSASQREARAVENEKSEKGTQEGKE